MELDFSISGAGWIVEKVYLPFFTRFFPNSTIYLYDPYSLRTQILKEKYKNIIITSTFEEACNLSPVCIICSPNKEHYNQVLYALKLNKKVICEKPLCLSNYEAEEVKKNLNKDNMLFVSRPFLFRRDIKKLSQIIDNNDLGNIFRINIKWLRKNGIPGSAWFAEKEKSGGGVLIDLGSHILDLLLFFLKEKMPHQCFADLQSIFINDPYKSANWHSHKKETKDTGSVVEDNAIIFLKSTKISATVELSWASHVPNDITMIEIYGKKGYACLETIFGFSTDTRIKSPKLVVDTSDISKKYRFNNNRIAPYFEMLKHYISVIRGHEEPQLTLQGIFGAIQLIESIYSLEK